MNHWSLKIQHTIGCNPGWGTWVRKSAAVALVLLLSLTMASIAAHAGDFTDFSKILNPVTNSQSSASSNQPAAFIPQPSSGIVTNSLTSTNSSQPTTVSNQPPVQGSMEALDDKHPLAIGDRLSFRIVEDAEDPREPLEPKPMIVTDSGEVEVTYIGRILAAGKTCRKLAHDIKAALEKEYYFQATVIIAVDSMTKSRGRVYVVGPVRMPGPQEIPSDEVLTLSKAIMRAGGFNDYADKQHVKVTRQGGSGARDKQGFVVDVGQIFDKGKTEMDLPLEPGDLIMVPERLIRF